MEIQLCDFCNGNSDCHMSNNIAYLRVYKLFTNLNTLLGWKTNSNKTGKLRSTIIIQNRGLKNKYKTTLDSSSEISSGRMYKNRRVNSEIITSLFKYIEVIRNIWFLFGIETENNNNCNNNTCAVLNIGR